jgi:copper chaperone CopZ
MRKKILMGFIISLFFACSKPEKAEFNKDNLIKDSIAISGMVCDGCAQTICSRIKKEEGVAECAVNFDDSTAYFTFDKTQTSREKIKSAIKDAGYEIR